MWHIKDFWNLLIKYKNQIYLFLLLNYLLFFLIKTTKILFFEFTSNKELPLMVYLFWAIQSFLVKKSVFVIIATFLSVLGFFILDFLICFYIFKLLELIKNNAELQSKINFLKSEYFIIIFLLIFSGFIRFAFLSAGLYHHDAFQLAVAVEKIVEEGKIYGIGGGRYGAVLANVPFFYFFKTFFGYKSAEFTVNFTSALFGIISILILYLLAKNLFNDKFIAFSSSMLYSVTPIFLSVSTFAKEHTLDVFLSLSSLLLLAIGLKKSKNNLILLSGLLLSFLVYIRFPSILIVFSSVLLICLFGGNKISRRDRIKHIVLYLLPFVIVIASYAIFSYATIINEAKSNFGPLSLNQSKYIVVNNFKYSAEGLVFSLTIVGTILSIFGFVLLFREEKTLFYFLIVFFISLFMFYALSKTVAHRFFSLPIVGLIIALSYTLSYIKKKDAYASTFLLILLVIIFFANVYQVIKFRHEFSAFKDLAKIVNDNTNPHDSVVILYGDDTPALNYYSKTPTESCDYNPSVEYLMIFVNEISNLLDKDYKVYISGACFGLGNRDERSLFLDIMDSNFRGSIVAEYVSDDYHRGSIKPTIKRISMLRLYKKNSFKGNVLNSLQIKY